MAHCTIMGKIVFSEKFERKDVVELSYFLMQKAMDNRIGINLDCNLTRKAEYFYPIKNYIKEGCIPYEILDNPLQTNVLIYLMISGSVRKDCLKSENRQEY